MMDGKLFLGETREAEHGSPYLYDSDCLTTHGIVLGTTGSGKTGLCLALLEEASMHQIPVIAVDIKGDVGNLLLRFPRLQPDDFTEWIDPVKAEHLGLTPQEYAEQVQTRMANGLAYDGLSPRDIQRFIDTVDVEVKLPDDDARPLTPQDVYEAWRRPLSRGKITVFNVALMSDDAQMKYATSLLESLVMLMRHQPASQTLRLLVYLDEVYGWFPPVGKTPAKKPLMKLVKQARAYGIGLLLATQNPGDLDYRSLSNIGTWFVGRMQTDRDRNRVAETIQAVTGDDVRERIAELAPREFLVVNNRLMSADVIRSRQTLCYLYGPMTHTQIECFQSPSSATVGDE